METQSGRPWYFNLRAKDDTAVVRLLHTSTKTIEAVDTHRITMGDKSKRIKCLGENCPFCKKEFAKEKRIYIHLWNYDESKEEVWDRTDKIIPQLQQIENAWGPLNTAVVRITRTSDAFPKYDIVTLNPTQYDNADNYKELVDKPLAKFYSLSKKSEEIEQYLATGTFPERPAYLPKEEYLKQKQAQTQSASTSTTPVTNPSSYQPQPQAQPATPMNSRISSDSLPF